jgi:RimJ/RimL family protein N-acetyltransferase
MVSRLYLKSPSRDDVLSYIRKLWADEATMKDVGGIHLMDEERAERWFAKWIEPGQEDRRYFLVVLHEGDIPIGEVCFYSFQPETKMAKFSMNIEAKYRGNGYAAEAMKLMLRFYFGEFGGEVMVDDIHLNNVRAQQVFLKFGWEHDPSLGEMLSPTGGDDVFWVRIDKGKFEQLYGLVTRSS